jgi:hypothetical protein
MIGGSTEGNSRTPNDSKPINPKIRITIDKTVAKTGRLILIEDKLIELNF